MSSRLALSGVSKAFGGRPALCEVSLTVEQGTLTALTGPSGSGKTTLLKIVAGLLEPDAGTVEVAASSDERPRAVLVFQDNLLFPHLRVVDNVTFGPRARRVDRDAARTQALDLLERLGVGDKAQAWPGELSAGQQQRVAVARALAANPAVLLLDEPFANLDRGLRLETAQFVRDLQRERGLTVLLVTHGQEEAFLVADQVAYLRAGRLVQVGTSQDFRLRPADLDTARFTGEVNAVPSQNGSPTEWFRAAEARIVADANGEARVEALAWTGQSFRTTVAWRGTSVTVVGAEEPPPVGTPVHLTYRTLTFQEKP